MPRPEAADHGPPSPFGGTRGSGGRLWRPPVARKLASTWQDGDGRYPA